MKKLILIPARLASTRLPNKMIANIAGRSLIQRTFLRVQEANLADKVVVATDSDIIVKEIEAVGGEAILTDINHNSGTMRCEEALSILESRGEKYDWIINVQGDEIFVELKAIGDLFEALQKQENIHLASMMESINDWQSVENPNIVKVVHTQPLPNSNLCKALYFSRHALPFMRDANAEKQAAALAQGLYKRHIGVYGFSAKGLHAIAQMPASTLESTEMLEQLRWLENGWAIAMLHIQPLQDKKYAFGIDTAEDLEKAKKLLE